MRKINILNSKIDVLKKDSFSKSILELLNGHGSSQVCKINTEFLVRANRSKDFLKTLNESRLCIPDGRGVLWAARYSTLPISSNKLIRSVQSVWQMFYSGISIVFNPNFITFPIPENIPGLDALKLMLMAAEETNSGVFFLGAAQNDLDKAIENIRKEMPKLNIAGSMNGYDFQTDKTFDPVAVINATEAKLLIVALGSPLQEFWIRDSLPKLKKIRVAVGEGGTLDRIANPSQAAPSWVNRIGLEWLWRLFFNKSLTKNSGSRFKRVWNAVPVFVYEVVKWKIKNGAIEVE